MEIGSGSVIYSNLSLTVSEYFPVHRLTDSSEESTHTHTHANNHSKDLFPPKLEEKPLAI